MTRFTYFLDKAVEELISTFLGYHTYEVSGCAITGRAQCYDAFKPVAAGAGAGSCVGVLAKGSRGKNGVKKKK